MNWNLPEAIWMSTSWLYTGRINIRKNTNSGVWQSTRVTNCRKNAVGCMNNSRRQAMKFGWDAKMRASFHTGASISLVVNTQVLIESKYVEFDETTMSYLRMTTTNWINKQKGTQTRTMYNDEIWLLSSFSICFVLYHMFSSHLTRCATTNDGYRFSNMQL